jgi:hypothetical protein
MAENKVVIIDDGLAVSIITNTKITQAIPALKVAADNAKTRGISPNKGGCKPCQPKASNLAIDLMYIKQSIAQLSDSDRKKLKEFLKTDKIRMVYRTQSNRLVQLTY